MGSSVSLCTRREHIAGALATMRVYYHRLTHRSIELIPDQVNTVAYLDVPLADPRYRAGAGAKKQTVGYVD